MEQVIKVMEQAYKYMVPHLNEKLQRLLMGAFASAMGHGGINAVPVLPKLIGKPLLTARKSSERSSRFQMTFSPSLMRNRH
jgi:hypothetical protein